MRKSNLTIGILILLPLLFAFTCDDSNPEPIPDPPDEPSNDCFKKDMIINVNGIMQWVDTGGQLQPKNFDENVRLSYNENSEYTSEYILEPFGIGNGDQYSLELRYLRDGKMKFYYKMYEARITGTLKNFVGDTGSFHDVVRHHHEPHTTAGIVDINYVILSCE